MRKSWLVAGALASAMGSAAWAQQKPKELTLDALFQSPSLSGPSLRGLQLSPDGTMVALLKECSIPEDPRDVGRRRARLHDDDELLNRHVGLPPVAGKD